MRAGERAGLGFPRAMEAAAAAPPAVASSASASASAGRSRPSTSAAQVCLSPPAVLRFRVRGSACGSRLGSRGQCRLDLVVDAAAIGRFGVIRAEIWRRLWGCRVAGAGFRCRALADCFVCAAARARSFREVFLSL